MNFEDNGDDGDEKDLGLSDDQPADYIALQTRSSHDLRQSSVSFTREKSASVKLKAQSTQMKISGSTTGQFEATGRFWHQLKLDFPSHHTAQEWRNCTVAEHACSKM